MAQTAKKTWLRAKMDEVLDINVGIKLFRSGQPVNQADKDRVGQLCDELYGILKKYREMEEKDSVVIIEGKEVRL